MMDKIQKQNFTCYNTPLTETFKFWQQTILYLTIPDCIA
jgi:hypothetical protein